MAKVLVVEDREENTVAVYEFFKSIGMEIEVATNLQEAVMKLEQDFLAAIIDIEIPRIAGTRPERLGQELGEIARNLYLTHIFLTGGTGNHSDCSYISFDCKEIIKNGPAKSDPMAWKYAWAALSEGIDLQRNLNSRMRYRTATGKQFRRS